jgi:ribosomal protein S13
MKIEVSNGEILDKFSILIIKRSNINDDAKLDNIQKEIDQLENIVDELIRDKKIFTKYFNLAEVNKRLWDIEDDIRECERQKDFGDKFIQLARSVYISNDLRAKIKKEINLLTNSGIVEEKSYESY